MDIEVVAADRKLFVGKAVSMVIPGVDGYFGVLHGHAPLVAALGIGELDITRPDDGSKVRIAIAGGFAEVMPDRVVVISDAAEMAEQIDIERARQAKERAEARLAVVIAAGADTDVDRAKVALMRAINRLKIAGGI